MNDKKMLQIWLGVMIAFIVLMISMMIGNTILTKFIQFLAIMFFVYIFFKIKNWGHFEHLNYTQEFEELYKKIENKVGKRHEKLLNVNLLCFFAGFLSLAVFLIFILTRSSSNYTGIWYRVAVISLFVFSVVNAISAWIIERRNRLKYKNIVVPNLVENIDENLYYNKTIDAKHSNEIRQLYNLAAFDSNKYDVFEAEDEIIGVIDKKIPFEMQDIHLKTKEKVALPSDSSMNGPKYKEYEETVFSGLFAIANIEKNVNEKIQLLTNKIKILDSKKRNELDSSEFEKIFDVYSENRVLVTRIFTTKVMEDLVKFYYEYKIPFEIIVNKQIIFLRFFTNDVFEYRFFNNKKNI